MTLGEFKGAPLWQVDWLSVDVCREYRGDVEGLAWWCDVRHADGRVLTEPAPAKQSEVVRWIPLDPPTEQC